MKKSKLYIAGFESNSVQPNFYNLIVNSNDQSQKINIVLNQYEAQVISHIISGGQKNQLYAYGSIDSILHSLDIKVKKVELQKRAKGQLSAFVIGNESLGVPFKSAVRPVDALILSLLNNCPIFFADNSNTDYHEKATNNENLPLEELSLNALRSLLTEYLAVENYEKACVIRDLIQERNQKIV
jgi:bifunctional DNase/RNase